MCNLNKVTLYLYLLIVGNMIAEVDSFYTTYIPDMQGDNVLCVLMHLLYYSCCPTFHQKAKNSGRPSIFAPQHVPSLLPEPHYELWKSGGFQCRDAPLTRKIYFTFRRPQCN